MFIVIDCGSPIHVANATVMLRGTQLEDTANYTCEVGFRFPSGATLVMTSCRTGLWLMRRVDVRTVYVVLYLAVCTI